MEWPVGSISEMPFVLLNTVNSCDMVELVLMTTGESNQNTPEWVFNSSCADIWKICVCNYVNRVVVTDNYIYAHCIYIFMEVLV